MAVLGVDGAGEQAARVPRHQGRQKGRQGGDADDRNAGRKPDAARRGDADAQARIAAGPTVTATRSRPSKPPSTWETSAIDQRQQRFGMAALHRDGLAREQRAALRCRGCRPSRRRGRYRWQGRAMFVSVWWRLFRACETTPGNRFPDDHATDNRKAAPQAALRSGNGPIRRRLRRPGPRAHPAGSGAAGSGCRASGWRWRTGSPSRRPS